MNFIVFGDSITWGACDTEGGWVARLRKSTPSVYNLGVPGETTRNLLLRFENELKVRIDSGDENTIIIAIGINDSHHKIPPLSFKANLNKLIKIGGNYSQDIIFVGLTPVDEAIVDDFSQKEVEKYNQIVNKTCEENKIDFIDLMSSFLEKEYRSLLADGLHPNDQGHELIYLMLKQYLLGKSLI